MTHARSTTRGDGLRAVSAVVVAICAVLATLGVGRAAAIETDTFRLTPSPLVVHGLERRSFTFDPAVEQTYTDAVRVENKTDEPRRYRLYGADARRSTETDTVVVDPAEVEPRGVGSWVEFERTEVEVAPGDWEVVPFTVTVPSGTTTEGFGAIVAEQILDDIDEEGGVDLVYRLALLIRLDGDIAGLVAGEPRFDPPIELFPSSSDISVALTNETLETVRATVRFTAGGVTGRYWEIAEQQVELAAGESTDVTATWTTVPRWGGYFAPTAEVAWERGSVVRTGSRRLHPPLWLLALVILVIGLRAVRELRTARQPPPATSQGHPAPEADADPQSESERAPANA